MKHQLSIIIISYSLQVDNHHTNQTWALDLMIIYHPFGLPQQRRAPQFFFAASHQVEPWDWMAGAFAADFGQQFAGSIAENLGSQGCLLLMGNPFSSLDWLPLQWIGKKRQRLWIQCYIWFWRDGSIFIYKSSTSQDDIKTQAIR